MNISKKTNGDIATITLSGRFVFDSHREFRDAYTSFLSQKIIRGIDVDLKQVEYIDSSALGMLLLLNEKVRERGATLRLINVHGAVKQILEVANFGKLFEMVSL